MEANIKSLVELQIEIQSLHDIYSTDPSNVTFQELKEDECDVILQGSALDVTLTLKIPMDYPEEIPKVQLKTWKFAEKRFQTRSEEFKSLVKLPQQLSSLLRSRAKTIKGEPMLYELIEYARELFEAEDERLQSILTGDLLVNTKSQPTEASTKKPSYVTDDGLILLHQGDVRPVATELELSKSQLATADTRLNKADISVIPVECWVTILSFLPTLHELLNVGQATLSWSAEIAILAVLSPLEEVKPGATELPQVLTKRYFPTALRKSFQVYKQHANGFLQRRMMRESAVWANWQDSDTFFADGALMSVTLVGAVGLNKVGLLHHQKLFQFLPSVETGYLRVASAMNEVFQWLERKQYLGIWSCKRPSSLPNKASAGDIPVKQMLPLPSELRSVATNSFSHTIAALCDKSELLLFRPNESDHHTYSEVFRQTLPADMEDLGYASKDQFLSSIGHRFGVFSSRKSVLSILDIEAGRFLNDTDDKGLCKNDIYPESICESGSIARSSFLVGFSDGSIRLLDLRMDDSKSLNRRDSWITITEGKQGHVQPLDKPIFTWANASVIAYCDPSGSFTRTNYLNPFDADPLKGGYSFDGMRKISCMASLDSLVALGHINAVSLWDSRYPKSPLMQCPLRWEAQHVALDSCKFVVAGTATPSEEGFIGLSTHTHDAMRMQYVPHGCREFEFGLDELSFASCSPDGKTVDVHWMRRQRLEPTTQSADQELQAAERVRVHQKNLVRERARQARQRAKELRAFKKKSSRRPEIVSRNEWYVFEWDT